MTGTNSETETLVERTVSATDEGITFTYQLYVHAAGLDCLGLVERLPEAVDTAAITFDDNDPEPGYGRTHEVAFVVELPQPEPIELTFQVESDTLDPRKCVSEIKTGGDIWTIDAGKLKRITTTDLGGPTGVEPTRLGTDGGVQRSTSSTGDRRIDTDAPREKTNPRIDRDLPAIGVLEGTNTETIARITHRATRHGLATVVAVDDEHGTVAQIVRRLGGEVVPVPTGEDTLETQKLSLLEAAREDTHPGLIVAGPPAEPIAVEASLEAFESSGRAIVEAVFEPSQTDVLVGIPAYNEAETIEHVCEAAREHADEVLVVDDGSDDRTAARAREAGATVVEHDRNRGYGSGLKTIFQEANERDIDSLVVLDADGQHDTGDIPRLIAEHEESDANIVIGNRFGDTAETDMPLYRKCGLWTITSLVNLSLGNISRTERISDAQSGYRSYDAVAIETIADHAHRIDDQMSASTDILQISNSCDLTVSEVPTTITYDVSNANTRHPVTHGLGIVGRIFGKLKRGRPITTFGVPGFITTLSGIGAGYWTILNIVTNGTVATESAMLSSLLIISGMVALMISAVQHTLNISFESIGLQ